MLGLNGEAPFGLQAAALTQEAPKFPSGPLPWDGPPSEDEEASLRRRACLSHPQLQGHRLGGGFEETLLLFARAEAMAMAMAMAREPLAPAPAPAPSPPSPGKDQPPFKPFNQSMSSLPCPSASSPTLPQHHHHPHHPHSHHPHPLQGLDVGDPLLEPLSPSALGAQVPPNPPPPALGHLLAPASAPPGHPPPPPPPPPAPPSSAEPRELEAFAERFKQRRMKLGVTQADVGAALGSLRIPGVGALSQSTICRFESLTLSHNNMVALTPVLRAWLREAEAAHRERESQAAAAEDPGSGPGAGSGSGSGPALALGLGLGSGLALALGLSAAERKRKRTSIAGPEKRSLEAYFALQPRPSSEKIAAIAEKLGLKKNVVRVWFCNQRQKQKRMKYSAGH